MKTLLSDIKNREFHRVYLLYGDESYLRIMFKKKLREAIMMGDTMNEMEADGKGVDFPKIKEFVETLPFFSEYRLAILEDTGLFSSANEDFAKWIPQIPETGCVIFVEEKVDKRNKLYKSVVKYGYAADLSKPSPAELEKWALKIITGRGKKITGPAMNELMMRAGSSMENLSCELEKLISFIGEKEGIMPEDVREICTEQVTSQVFRMIDALAEGNEKTALNLYYDMLTLREPSMRILYLIGKQLNQLMCVKEMADMGKRKDEVAATLKVAPFIAGKLLTQARSFRMSQLTGYVEECVKKEQLVKTGLLNEKLAVEMTMIMICRRER